jgi:ankyrin repeat protein
MVKPASIPELIQAVRATQLERVRELLADGVDPNVRSSGGRTALHAAAEEGILEAAQLLIDAGASIEARNFSGDTPLHCAARYGRGGDLMDPDADVRPLQLERSLHPDVARIMAEELVRRVPGLPPTVDITAQIPDPPGKMKVILEALRMIGDPEWRRSFDRTLRDRGFDVGRIDPALLRDLLGKPECLLIAELLIDRGADPNARNESGASPLYEAAGLGDVAMVELLLARGADPNLAGDNQYPPLEAAISFRRLDVAELLYKAGANVNPPGVDLLGLAVGMGSLPSAGTKDAPIARWLLERGAAVEGTRESYATPLVIAAQIGDLAAVQALLEHGADVGGRNYESGETALHAAAREVYPAVVRALLVAGAAVDARDAAELTPLHALFVAYEPWENQASAEDIREAVRALRDHGADIGAVDGEGRTALDIARANGVDDEILALLGPR